MLPAGLETITGSRLTEENVSDLAADFLSFFKTFLLVFSGIALLVATFSIYNTFSIIVAQRTRESALLRALGASRRQILGSVLAETAVVGLVASLLGAGGGLLIAGLLKGLFDAFGFSLPAGGLAIEATGVVVAGLIGLVVTVVSGLAPALKASRTAPMAALRETAVDGTGVVRGPGGGRLGHGRWLVWGSCCWLSWAAATPSGSRAWVPWPRWWGWSSPARWWPVRPAPPSERRWPGCVGSPACWPVATPCATPAARRGRRRR